ncbi:phage terminase small subunit [Arthrobacter russicus]|uniref:phage terminase small subunit n=1 Tax=Arthrobacter russicus TaxID=172040 RepID=UPI00337D04BF
MAGAGPAPSENPARRNKAPERTKLKADGALRGFALPSGVLGTDKDGEEWAWHPMTVQWWDGWRKSPQSTRMLSEPDWHFLLDTALMHHTMWSAGRWEYASEIRLRVAKFGATPEDRLRLRQEIDVPNPEVGSAPGSAGASVSSLEARRKRISG